MRYYVAVVYAPNRQSKLFRSYKDAIAWIHTFKSENIVDSYIYSEGE